MGGGVRAWAKNLVTGGTRLLSAGLVVLSGSKGLNGVRPMERRSVGLASWLELVYGRLQR